MPLYILEPKLWQQRDLSYRHYGFLTEALNDLESQLRELGMDLSIIVGETLPALDEINDKYQIDGIFAHQETGNNWTFQRDNSVRAWARQHNIPFNEFQSNGVVRNLGSRDGWSQLWKKAMLEDLARPRPTSSPIKYRRDMIPSGSALKLDTSQKLARQKASRAMAMHNLKSFVKSRSQNYSFEMSSPRTAEQSCSRISPYLAFGQISVREAYQITERRMSELWGMDKNHLRSLKSFSSRLRWHCHFIQKLEDQPNIETDSLHSSFENIRPRICDHEILAAWEHGNTGFPMIDACMRYLNQTGWINFRMRAMLVSFASYQLWLDWRLTANHLARQFLDYEPGIHFSQIQMQSGTTGMNSIRIYNPIKQSMDQDPEGNFIRKWVPELGHLSKQFIHQPWLLEDATLNYPKPIVDEKISRAVAKEKMFKLKKQVRNSDETLSLVQKHASRMKHKPRKNRNLEISPSESNQLSLDF